MAKKESKLKPPSRAQLIREFKSGKLLGTLFGKHSRGWGRDAKIVAAICTTHNDGDINVLSILTDEALAVINRNVFFQGQTLYCSLIPGLSADAAEMVRAVGALLRAAGNDGAAGLPVNELTKWCELSPERPRALLSLVDEGNEGAANFLPLTLRVGATFDREYFLDRAHAFALGSEPVRRGAAIQALGQIALNTPEEWNRFTKTLTTVATQGDDLAGAKVIGAAAGHLQWADVSHRAMIEEIVKSVLAAGASENCLHACADTLWLQAKHVPPSLRALLLNALLKIDPKNKGTIDHLDYGLEKIFEAGDRKEVIHFLEQLILSQKEAIKLKWFDSTCRAVHKAADGALADWVVSWFLNGDFDLCSQATKAFFGVERDGLLLDIDFNRYALRETDYPYLARKAIGFLFLQPLSAASIIISLIRSAPPATIAEVEDLLFDPMLLNYSGVDRNLLQSVARNQEDKAHDAVKRALERIEKYLADLNSAHPIRELRPSERQRQIELQRSADAMAEAYQNAEKSSFFASIVSRVIVLHGTRTISYHRMGKEEPRRIESKMGTHSVSYEMPRIEIADPVGLQRMLFSFRAERRPT